MEVVKRRGTLDTIAHLILQHKVKASVRPAIDLATFWRYWGGRALPKIWDDIRTLLRQSRPEKQRHPGRL